MNSNLAALIFGALSLAGCHCGQKPEPPAAAGSTAAVPMEAAPPRAAPSGPGLDASTLVAAGEVASWLPPGSTLQPLPGVPRSATYDGIRWAIAGSTDLGLTLQWWRFPTEPEAESRFDKNLASSTGAVEGTGVGSRSYRAPAYQHRELVFLDPATHSVVEIGCGEVTCVGEAGATRMLDLAKAILHRLGKGSG